MNERRTWGPLIVLEGCDGSGKGTIMKFAADYLVNKFGSENVVMTKDPGGTKLGAEIRRIIYEVVPTRELAPGVVDLLFLVSHMQNWLTVVKPALEGGKVVLTDRWWYSQNAYMTQRHVPEGIARAYEMHHGDRADLLIFLHGDVRFMTERARSREHETHQSAKTWNDERVLEQIQLKYFELFSHKEEWRDVCVDRKGPDAVWEEVRDDVLAPFLKDWEREHA